MIPIGGIEMRLKRILKVLDVDGDNYFGKS